MTAPGWVWALLVAILASGPISVRAAEGQAGQRQNVVMIVADDLGLELGCYGDKTARTPRIDALAREGTRFPLAFCTTASCSASRSVILTGLHNHANGQFGHQHGYNNFHTFETVRSLPKLLKSAGYRTCAIGKIHVQPSDLYGFDVYADKGTQGGRNAVRMAENARQFLRESGDKPFFLYFCPADPHRAGKGFANDQEYPGVETVRFDPDKLTVPHFLPDRSECRRELSEYYRAVSRLDQGVGRLLDALQETGHRDDTLVLFLSDNGMPFPGAKTTVYEPGLRLPLIVRRPRSSASGTVCEAMVTWADLVPTILDFTGAAGPQDYKLHGRSFLTAMDEAQPAGWDETYASHTFHEITMYYPMRAIRTRRHKLILNVAWPLSFPFASDLFASPTWQGVLERNDPMYGSRPTARYLQRPQWELYDLERDPQELTNLAADPAHAELLASLQQKLRDWQTATKDPWAVKYRHE